METKEPGRMRHALHYFVEFLVILLGISVSVSIEKDNARVYKEEIKDQSLTRILQNIAQDSTDLEFNIYFHSVGAAACDWMVSHRSDYQQFHPDTVGKHCSLCLQANTIFVDNQEEYRGLQNSGLIELIENDKLANALQLKYVQHEFLRQLEKEIVEQCVEAMPSFYDKFEAPENFERFDGFVVQRRWMGGTLESSWIERFIDISSMRRFYRMQMEHCLRSDTELKAWIEAEIDQ